MQLLVCWERSRVSLICIQNIWFELFHVIRDTLIFQIWPDQLLQLNSAGHQNRHQWLDGNIHVLRIIIHFIYNALFIWDLRVPQCKSTSWKHNRDKRFLALKESRLQQKARSPTVERLVLAARRRRLPADLRVRVEDCGVMSPCT